MKRIVGFIFLFVFCLSLYSQIDSSRIYYRKIAGNYVADSLHFNLDSNLYGVHQPNSISFLGNIGVSQMPLLFQFQNHSLSNQAYNINLNVPIFKVEDIKFCQSFKPLFSVYAFSGRGQEQLLDAFHTQTLRKQFSYTFRFYRGNSQGFMNRQRTNFSQFYLALNIPLFKNKYGAHRIKLLPYIINNLNNFNENGGVANDSALDNVYKNVSFFSSAPVSFLKIKLLDANRKITNTAFGSENHLLIKYDSLTTVKTSLVHHIHFDRQKNTYTDTKPIDDKSIYPIFYNSATNTNDSMYHAVFSNTLSFRTEKIKQHVFEIGANYERTKYTNNGFQRKDENYSIHVLGNKQMRFGYNNLFVNAYSEYVLAGNLNNGFLARANANWLQNDSSKTKFIITANYQFSNRKPVLFYQQYGANSFLWNNMFKPIIHQQFDLAVSYLPLKLRAAVFFETITNGIVMSTYQRPDQIDATITNTRLALSHELAWKRLRFFNTLNFQVSSNTSLVKMPNLYTKHSLFYESKTIKKNFKFQVGIDVQYLPSFQSYAYSPGTNQFYLQNQFKTKDQVYADLFFNLYIKPVYIFFKMEHANQFYFPQQSEVVETYLLKPRALRFGLRWNFLD